MSAYTIIRDAITGRILRKDRQHDPRTSVKETIRLYRPALRKAALTAKRKAEEARTEEARDAYLWAASEFMRLAAK